MLNGINRFKLGLPLTFAFLACFLVLAFTVNYRSASVPAAAGANGRQVIVLDAGHGARVLSIVVLDKDKPFRRKPKRFFYVLV